MAAKLPKGKHEEIVSLYLNGLTSLEISEKLNVWRGTVNKCITKAGVRNSTQDRPERAKPELTNKIEALYKSGLNGMEISKIVDISFPQVYKRLANAGVKTRLQTDSKRKYKLDQDFFETIDTEGKAYWLGFIYADGCVHKNALSIALSEKDKEHLQSFLSLISPDRPIRTYASKYSKTPLCSIEIKSAKLVSDLNKLGVVANKTFLLDCLPDIPIQHMRHFIRGYFDGDGSVSIRKDGNYRGVCMHLLGTSKFLDAVQALFVSQLQITLTKLTQCKRDNPHTFQYSKGGNVQIRKIFDFLYQDSSIYLERKFSKFKEVFI